MAPILEIKNVYKFFGPKASATAVLEDVSFELEQGEFLCVMGPSGSGKSSLLHLIAGLDEPSAGEVVLQGQSLAALNRKQRTRLRRDSVGYVFQFFNLLPNLTVSENVGLPLAIQGQRGGSSSPAVRGLLERFGLGERLGHLPHQLSGGQMQRTSIARALVGEQPLLLCDEPTGNLSQAHGTEIMQTLREVCDQDGRSVLLVTHNPRDAAYADRVLFLVDGQVDPANALTGEITVERVHESLLALNI